ncbi:MAG: hypothetical protein ABIO82_03375 [Ginsengibacter sp.]
MNITIATFPKEDYLLIESKGTVETMEELLAHSQMIWEEISKYDFKKILVDDLETIFPLDLASYFNLVKNYVENFPPEIYEAKITIVASEIYKEVMFSWETLCQSRGLQYFVFTSIEDAVHCLTSDDDE